MLARLLCIASAANLIWCSLFLPRCYCRREHLGRQVSARCRVGTTSGTAAGVLQGDKRILRHGDPLLKLRVEGLNGFDAMMATMKEMGYDEEASDLDHQDEQNGSPAVDVATQYHTQTAGEPTPGHSNAVESPSQNDSPNMPSKVNPAATSVASLNQETKPRAVADKRTINWSILIIIAVVLLTCAAAAIALAILASNSSLAVR